MTTVAIACIGTGASLWMARLAKRFAVTDRLRVAAPGAMPAWLRARLARLLDAAAIDTPPEQVLQLWLLGVLVAGMTGVAFDIGLGLALSAAVLAGGPAWLHLARHRRERKVAAAVPDAIERVAAELRSGGTVFSALRGLALDDGALAGDIARIETRVELGASLPEALATWARERPVPGVASVAGALAVAHEAGGRSAAALDSLSASLRARVAVVAEAHALSAQARYSALVVGLGPLAYLGFSFLVDRNAVDALVGTPGGRLCMVAGIGLEVAGAWWMRRILGVGATA